MSAEPFRSFAAYWNGLPTSARRARVRVPQHDPTIHAPLAWWRFGSEIGPPCEGQVVDAVIVELDGVNYGGGIAVLYDGDGTGFEKITTGRGGPMWPHKQLPDECEVVK